MFVMRSIGWMSVFSIWFCVGVLFGQYAPDSHPILYQAASDHVKIVEPAQTDDIYLEIMPSWHSNDQDGRQRLAAGDLNGDGYPEVYSTCRPIGGFTGGDLVYTNISGILNQDASWRQDPPLPCYSADMTDVDLDGDLDVAVADSAGGAYFVNIGGTLELEPTWQAANDGVAKDIAWTRITGDAYGDLVVANDDSAGQNYSTSLYLNSIGALAILPSWTKEPARDFCLVWGDIDNDGDADLCVGTFGGQDHIYRTTNGALEEWAHWTSYLSDGTLSIAFADINADGWLDVVEGNYDTPNRVYFNQGDGEFETSPSWSSTVVTNTWQLALGDIDNDGDIDLACGAQNPGDTDKVFENTGTGLNPVPTWTSALATNTVGMVLADKDLDNDLDLVTASPGSYLYVYENLVQTPNTAPEHPNILTADVLDSSVTLSWNNGSDTETPTNLLTYSLRVGTGPGLANLVYAEIGPENTHPSFGNMWHAQTKTLNNLYPTTYYWSVQTVDAGLSRSAWAPEQSFEISSSVTDRKTSGQPLEYGILPLYPNPFNPSAALEFYLPRSSPITLKVHNTLGQTVAIIASGMFDRGIHSAKWNGRDHSGNAMSSGIYLFVLQTELGVSVRKGMLLR